MNDGKTAFSFSTDSLCSAALAEAGPHAVTFSLDGGPNIMTVAVNGVLCDGSGDDPFGWAWFPKLSTGMQMYLGHKFVAQ